MSRLNRRIAFFVLLALSIVWLLPAAKVEAAVTLVYLDASADISVHAIVISWQTGSELNNAGFYIQRSAQQSGSYNRLSNTIIPSVGDAAGSEYSYNDATAQDCVIYYYRLEVVDNSGHSVVYERDPGTNQLISSMLDPSGNCANLPTPTSTNTFPPNFTPSVTPTPTRTATPTITMTPTNTPIGFTPQATATPTFTRTPTRTTAPTFTPTFPPTSTAPPTPSATQTLPTGAVGQITATLIPTPTGTLEPLPTMQLIFPAHPTSEPITPGVTVIVVTPTLTMVENQGTISSRTYLLVGAVIVLWLGLMAFLVAFLRKASQ